MRFQPSTGGAQAQAAAARSNPAAHGPDEAGASVPQCQIPPANCPTRQLDRTRSRPVVHYRYIGQTTETFSCQGGFGAFKLIGSPTPRLKPVRPHDGHGLDASSHWHGPLPDCALEAGPTWTHNGPRAARCYRAYMLRSVGQQEAMEYHKMCSVHGTDTVLARAHARCKEDRHAYKL